MALLLLLVADVVTLELTVDRTTAHAGEYLFLNGVARASQPATLPRTHELVVCDPDGAEYRRRIEGSGADALAAGAEKSVVRLWLRLDPPREGWSPRPPPLRRPGEWSARLVVGDLESGGAKWTVRKVGKVRGKPTAPQLAALRRYLRDAPGYSRADAELLWKALREAENDGLAQHLIDLLAGNASVPGDVELMRHLVERAAATSRRDGALQFGIDGPYLPRLGRLVLEAWEAKDAGKSPNPLLLSGTDALVAWIHFDPGEEQARAKLVRLATKSARRVLGAGRPRGAGPIPIVTAWRALLELEVLRPGMALKDAIAILGEPDPRSNVRWYLNSPMHVNPGLGAVVEDGKIRRIRIYWG